MKNNITYEQLLQLNAEHILDLSKSETINTDWQDWYNIHHVEDAVNAYETKGVKHHSLNETMKECNIANLINILRTFGEVKVVSFFEQVDKLGYLWKVEITQEDGNQVVYTNLDLCDALWEAYIRLTQAKNRRVAI